jgi:hypothetical protein
MRQFEMTTAVFKAIMGHRRMAAEANITAADPDPDDPGHLYVMTSEGYAFEVTIKPIQTETSEAPLA